MKKNKFTESDRLDMEVQRMQFLHESNDLWQVANWLEDGYKDGDGKNAAIELLRKESRRLREEQEKLFKILFP